MAENVSFRSSFNGFNREEVVRYIAGLMEKIAAGDQKAAELEQQAAQGAEALDGLQKKCDAWESERNELTERCAALENELAAQTEECAARQARIAELELQLDEYARLSRQNEVKLGEAMLDAKRFSEMLVQEANDRAGEVYRNAYESVSRSADSAREIDARMKELSGAFERTMGELRRDMFQLIDRMAAFTDSAKDNGARFLYRSEFTGEND